MTEPRRKELTVKFTCVEIKFLLSLLLENRIEGNYLGNKAQYEKRSLQVSDKLERALPDAPEKGPTT